DTFSSVTAGLGIFAQGLEVGREEAPVFTATDVAPSKPAETSRPRVSPANIETLRRRIQVQEGVVEAELAQADRALVVLSTGKEITAVPLPEIFNRRERGERRDFEEGNKKSVESAKSVDLRELELPTNGQRAITADWDEQLLITTSKYRFLLLTPRQLAEQQVAKVTLNQVFQLEEREVLCTVARWGPIKQQEKLLLV
ncbi:MAG: hypothetical protein KC445_21560, partial [Anaerolineales bacterium]|nr:hypothetical protein [Anaerolineales bacterium]